MHCLVLGGAGFLGSHVCEALLGKGHRVRVFERPRVQPAAKHLLPELEWVEGDFLNPSDVRGAVSGAEVIFHLIGTTLPKTSNENPVYDVESNVLSTLRLLDAAGDAQVVFFSSGGTVYGPPQVNPMPETHPTHPICSYGITKLTVEKYLALYRRMKGLRYCALRVSNPFGEYQRTTATQGAVGVFISKILRGEEIEIWGDGSVVRDFVYARDVAEAAVRAMSYDGQEGVFNIGSGVGSSLNDLLAGLENVVGQPIARRYLVGRQFDVSMNVLDISRAAAELSWRPRTLFLDGLEKTYIWMRAQFDRQKASPNHVTK